MKEPKWWLDTESLQGSDFAMSTAFSALLRKVFIWMALALVITGVTAYEIRRSDWSSDVCSSDLSTADTCSSCSTR